MVGVTACTRPGAPRLSRCVLALTVAASTLRPGDVVAAPTSAAAADLAAFDAGFRDGQEQFNRKEFLTAARTWTRAAELLPESEEHRDNRRAIYEYIADAYEKAVVAGDEATVREGLTVLDAYATRFTATYAGEAVPERVAQVRAAFRAVVDAADAEKARADTPALEPERPVPPPAKPSTAPAKPWKPLAIGGGVAVGGGVAMLALFAAGAARAKSAEARFDDPANNCSLDQLAGECATIDSQGRTANGLAIAGLVAAPLLIGAGVAMLVIAKRRKAGPPAIAPLFGRSTAGLVVQGRF